MKKKNPTLVAFGKRFAKIRRARMPQSELEKKTDIKREYISKIETGEINVTFLTLQKLADGLEVPLSVLVISSNDTIFSLSEDNIKLLNQVRANDEKCDRAVNALEKVQQIVTEKTSHETTLPTL
jgi:transcriptional regulator with XRE-family HTH domain